MLKYIAKLFDFTLGNSAGSKSKLAPETGENMRTIGDFKKFLSSEMRYHFDEKGVRLHEARFTFLETYIYSRAVKDIEQVPLTDAEWNDLVVLWEKTKNATKQTLYEKS